VRVTFPPKIFASAVSPSLSLPPSRGGRKKKGKPSERWKKEIGEKVDYRLEISGMTGL